MGRHAVHQVLTAETHRWSATNLLRRNGRRDVLPIALPAVALDRFRRAGEVSATSFL